MKQETGLKVRTLTLLVVAACGGAPEQALPPSAPSDTTPQTSAPPVPAEMDEVAPAFPPEPAASEGMNGAVDLGSSEPVDPSSAQPAEPGASEPAPGEPSDMTAAPTPPIPAIAAPGFPAGSAPRLVPMALTGPVTGRPILFNIYLPPGYDSGTASYPVLYDLHGLTDSRDTNPGPVIRSLEAAMRNQVIGPLIVVFPQGFVEAYWADTRDGARPGETQVIRELLPYVDASFRTLPFRARRGVTGFSMGGFGAFAYATKYPELFSVGIGYDSALDTWETLVGRRGYIASAAFGNDESSFDQISPWASATRNAAALSQSSRLRGVTGSQYRDFNAAFRDHLAAAGIAYEYVETDCPHNYGCPIDRAGQDSWALIQTAFSQPAMAGAP